MRDCVLAAVVGGKRVADDGERGEREAIRGESWPKRGGSDWIFRKRRIRKLQGAEHVLVPVKEEADFRRAAAGGAAHGERGRERC